MDILTTLNGYIPYFTQIVKSMAVIVGAYIVNKFIFKRTINKFAERAELEPHYTKPFKHLISAVIYIAALLFILSIFGLKGSLTSLLAGAGVIGIVIGMATKDVLSGLISGMIIYVDRPFKIGDWIEIDGKQGIVQDLSLESTRVRTFSGELLTIPNSKITNSMVTNKTAEPNSRLEIGIGVDYETDMDRAIRVCKELLDSNEYVLKEPESDILISEFGDSSINLTVRFWVNRRQLSSENLSLPRIISRIRNQILEKFREEDVSIPFPHLEVMQHGRWEMGK